MAPSNEQSPHVSLKSNSHVLHLSNGASVSNGPLLKASVAGGKPVVCMVDTGSTGAVLGAHYFGDDFEPTDKQFQLLYTSSGNAYRGYYVLTHLTLYGAADGEDESKKETTQTAPMLVRKVDEFRAGYGGDWSKDQAKVKVAMLGIGFDRDTGVGTDPGGFPIPQGLNPFLKLEEMEDGSMTRGFIIDLQTPCITLGLTVDNTEGFRFLKLHRQDPPPKDNKPDWVAPNVWMSVPSANINPMETSLLIDTGLGYSIIQAPLGLAPPQVAVQNLVNTSTTSARVQVADGQRIVLAVRDVDVPLYSFEVGKRDAPQYVSWRFDTKLHNGMPFINTSRHALSQFDYLIDEDNGRLGFFAKEQAVGVQGGDTQMPDTFEGLFDKHE